MIELIGMALIGESQNRDGSGREPRPVALPALANLQRNVQSLHAEIYVARR
jgi:hypothetical protein